MDDKTGPTGDLFSSMTNQWLGAQQQYWDSWSDAAHKTMNAATPTPSALSANPWADALGQWWRGVSPGMPPSGLDIYSKMMGSGKPFFSLGEQFAAMGAQPNMMSSMEQWLNQMSSALTAMSQGVMPSGDRALQDAMGFWSGPIESWQKIASGAFPMMNQFTNMSAGADPLRMMEGLSGKLTDALSLPGVGLFRESQEEIQRLARLTMEYNEAMQEYSKAFASVGTGAVERMRQKIAETDPKAAPVDSLRKFYDIWVEVREAAYGEFMSSSAYPELYGRLNNALMAVKGQANKIMERGFEAMNIPTRREIDTVHQRLQETRRENRTLRAELERLRAIVEPAARPAAKSTPAPSGAKATPARADKRKLR